MSTIGISEHVVDRYIERIHPDLSRVEAHTRLGGNLSSAVRVKGNTKYGQLRYLLPDCLLIVKSTHDEGLVAVTVYPLPARQGEAIPPATLLALERAGASANAELDAIGTPPGEPKPPRLPSIIVRNIDTTLENALDDLRRASERYEVARVKLVKETERVRGEVAAVQRAARQAADQVATAERTRIVALVQDFDDFAWCNCSECRMDARAHGADYYETFLRLVARIAGEPR